MASDSTRYCRVSRTYRLSIDVLEKIREMAEFNGVSDTAIIELAVREKLQKDRPIMDAEEARKQKNNNVR